MTEIKDSEDTAGAVAPATDCSHILCKWGSASKKPCKRYATCLTTPPGMEPYPTCDEHRKVAEECEWHIGEIQPMEPMPEPTPKFKWVIARSMRNARVEGSPHVTLEHLRAALSDCEND